MARLTQMQLPGCEQHGLLELRRFIRRNQRRQWKRPSQAERRLMAARRDPRQTSIYGDAHTKELTNVSG
jgi:hypothetical protein